MKFIAHRGYIQGDRKDIENTLPQIDLALSFDLDVEIDVRLKGDKLFLGHDRPQEEVSLDFLKKHRNRLWVHAKTLETFLYLLDISPRLNIFCQDKDPVVLTTYNKIWTHPTQLLYTEDSIAVKFRYEAGFVIDNMRLYGVCSNYPEEYRNEYLHILSRKNCI